MASPSVGYQGSRTLVAQKQAQNLPGLDAHQRYTKRLAALQNERNSWVAHWKELNDYLLPRRGRFNQSQKNQGTKQNNNIINSTPIRAVRVLSAGMHAGITSPARPWFRLSTPDPGLSEFGPVRSWLHVVEERLRLALARSNLYNVLPLLYSDLGVVGTAVALVEEDDEDGVRGYVFPPGAYCLANSARQQVDTVYRELSMTVAQLAQAFGYARLSANVKYRYDRGEYDDWVEVCHVIEPNRDREPERRDWRGKAFKSVWFEKARNAGDELFLRESGFEEFPVLAPRWDLTGEDVYGRSPGMDALGDAKALQWLERRKAQLVDKLANPPMVAPASLRNGRTSLLPGDVTFVDVASGGQKFEPAMQVNPVGVQLVDSSIREYEARINAIFFADLWLMMSESDRRQITAREVDERHEEKMLQLGPVLERLQDELLDPLIDRLFGIGMRRGWFPIPPQELSGQDLKVEYISIMAQAQKLLGTAAVERLASFVGSMAQAKPDVLDKLNVDEMVDEYASMLGTKPDLVVPDEQVAEIRAARAQAAAQQQQAAMAQQAAQGAKLLSETDMQGDNGLTRMLGAMGGTVPGAVV